MKLSTILKLINKNGMVYWDAYDHDISIICPFCNIHYHFDNDLDNVPCPYCQGSATIARNLSDSLEEILRNNFISLPLETMETLAEHTKGYYNFEILRRIRAKRKLLEENK